MNEYEHKNWEMVAQPKLARHTYWGNFRYNDSSFKEAVVNRNKLMEELCIVKHQDKSLLGMGCVFSNSPCKDHPEAYRTFGGGIVLIVSPYTPAIKADQVPPEPSCFNWTSTASIYVPGASTFYVTFKSISVLRAAVKRAAQYRVDKYAEEHEGSSYGDVLSIQYEYSTLLNRLW